MGYGDTLQPAYPNNTHKQDWAFYAFVGGRGGGFAVQTSVTRWSFWVDLDPFNVKTLSMLSENLTFQIFNDNLYDIPLLPYFIIDQSNDFTDELVLANLPTVSGSTVGVGTASIGLPPNGWLDSGFGTGGSFPPVSSATPAPTNATAALTEGAGSLTAGVTYYYVVTAVVGGVESVASNIASVTPTSSHALVGVGWTNVTGASYYNIYRNTSPVFTSGALSLVTFVYPGQPPYYNITNFTSQPVNNSYRNDQGNWTLKSYQNQGFGFGGTNMLTQGFVPAQSQLTGIFFAGLFHTNTTDHTKFVPLNFELWDANHNFIQHLGTLNPTYSGNGTAFLNSDAACTAICNSFSYNTGDDGNFYWINLNNPTLKFTNPVSLTPGSTYFLVVRAGTLLGSNYYFLGMNVDNLSQRHPTYYYPFASAYSATDGSSTWSQIVDANSKPITFPFLTQGNVGRVAVTYWWGHIGGTNAYWSAPPSGNEYTFLHIDYNQRI